MQLGLVGLGKMGGNMRERLRARRPRRSSATTATPTSPTSPRLAELVEALAAPRVVWVMVPAGEPTRDTVAELGRPARRAGDLVVDGGNSRFTDDLEHADAAGRAAASASSTAASPAASGAWTNGYALMVGGADDDVAQRACRSSTPSSREGESGLRPRRRGRCRPLRQDGPQRHRVRPDAGLRRGLRAARGERASIDRRPRRSSSPGARAPSCAPGCSTCWCAALRGRPRARPSSTATPRTPARAGGPSRRPSRLRVPLPVISAVAVRPVRLAAGRLAGDEGGRGAAQPVRRPRGAHGGRHRDRHGEPASGLARRHRLGRPPHRARRPPVARRLPLLRRPRAAARPGGDRVRRPERAGQDQPGRGDRLRRDAVQPPGRHGRTPGAARRRARGDPRRRGARRPAHAGRAGDQPGPGQPGAGQPRRRCRGPARCSACCAPCCSPPRTSRWSRATPSERRRFLDDLLVARRPALRRGAGRLRPGAQAAQRAAQVGRRGPARPAAPRAALHTLDVWDAHLAAARGRAAGRPAGPGRRRSSRWSTPPTTR